MRIVQYIAVYLFAAQLGASAYAASVNVHAVSGPHDDSVQVSHDLNTTPFSKYSDIGYRTGNFIFFAELAPMAAGEWYQVENASLAAIAVYQFEPESGWIEVPVVADFNPRFQADPRFPQIAVKLRFGNSVQFSIAQTNPANRSQLQLLGVFAGFGGMIALILYNLMIYFRIRSASHLYYCGYCIFVALCLASLTGANHVFPWHGQLNNLITLLGPVAIFCAAQFSKAFLNLKDHQPFLDRYFNGMCVLAVVTFLGFTLTGLKEFTYLTDVVIVFGAPALVYACFARWRQGYRPALFATISWGIVMATALMWVASIVNIVPRSYGSMIFSFGVLCEMIFLSLALADKVAFLERTLLIKTKNLNEDLKIQIENEKSVIREQQDRLMFSEKMASLGLMAKGIAHEVNNPLTIVKGQLDLIGHQLQRQDQNDELASLRKKTEIAARECQRIKDIILTLHNFARYDTDSDLDDVEINSVFKQIEHLTKAYAIAHSVEVEYFDHSDVSARGRPGQIVQVLSNLVMNAIDACPAVDGKVTVTVVSEADKVYVNVIDNGPGVAQDIANQIFDPFFSTKSSQKGTGLGLNIARGLMEAQQGKLYLCTETPATGGACFVMELRAATPDQAAA